MAIFSYVARDQAGRTRTGRIKGKSADEVASKLKAMGLSVVRVETVGGRGIRLPFFGGVSTRDLAIFSRQFAVMIEAGIPIVQALDILSEQTQKRRFRDVIRRVKEDVEGGKTLAESMKSHPKIFPHMLVQMVAVGETGGALGNTLKEVAAYYEKMDSLKRKIKAAAAYPMVIFVVLIAVTTFLLVFIIPRFAQLYADVGAKLPTPTMIVIGISNILKRFFIHIVIAVVVLIFLFRRFVKTDVGKRMWDNLTMRLIIFGSLIRKVAVARFARTLGILLSSGVPIMESMEITAKASGNKIIESAVLKARKMVGEGKTIGEPLRETGVFPPMVIHLITVGEQTGKLADMLHKIADFYDDEVDTAVAGLASVLEPVMVVIMGVFVGAILISMYLPIFGLAGTIR